MFQMMSLSNKHLTQTTLTRLERGDVTCNVAASLITLAYNHDKTGVMVGVYGEDIEKEEPGIPADLLNVLKYAREKGANYVIFDRDEAVNADLPVYSAFSPHTSGALTVRGLIQELQANYNPDAEVVVVNWSTGSEYKPTVGGDDEDEGSKYCRIGY